MTHNVKIRGAPVDRLSRSRWTQLNINLISVCGRRVLLVAMLGEVLLMEGFKYLEYGLRHFLYRRAIQTKSVFTQISIIHAANAF